ncbi:uncharacterized protein LOC136077683 [Hydra vulgaris]|uniref:Uncharacterized protein LOC136077683 n=1 Tax=Hydra vulgaris TaxID=6087 RepID=A0ABM4BG54_HYDVU
MSNLNQNLKKKKYSCIFNDVLQEEFSSFKKGRIDCEAECKICPSGTYISVSHKGALDLEYHLNTTKHKKCLKSVASTRPIKSFLQPKQDNLLQEKAHAAEGALAFHTVSHHQSFNSMDCVSKLHKTVYADSKIAKEVTCARTKSEAIITSVLSPQLT